MMVSSYIQTNKVFTLRVSSMMYQVPWFERTASVSHDVLTYLVLVPGMIHYIVGTSQP